MMKSKDLAVGDSENEFEVDEPEEVGDQSDDEWAPSAATAKSPGKRGRPPKNTPGRPKKKAKTEDDDEDDDDDEEEEILPKKDRGAKSKAPTTPAKGRGKAAAKTKAKKEKEPVEEEPELEPEEEEEVDDDDDDDEKDEDLEDEEDDDEEDDEEEELNQGPNAKPSKKFTSGAFVVLKTDMLSDSNPPVWKIDGKALLQKYIPFKQDGKLLYKNTSVYSGWGSNVKEQYYAATVKFIQQTRKEHIIEFFKDKIKKDPKVAEAVKKELDEDESELAGDDEDNEDEDEA